MNIIASRRSKTQEELEHEPRELKKSLEEQEALQDALLRQTFYDHLTGLPNRALLIDRMHQAFMEAGRSKNVISLLFIDLDGFKTVNDRFGHTAGDQVLAEVAKRVQAIIRREDTIARLGGDEFTVLIRSHHAPDYAFDIAKRILETISRPYDMGNTHINISASIGISTREPGDDLPEDLLHMADKAMYQAKIMGKSGISTFSHL